MSSGQAAPRLQLHCCPPWRCCALQVASSLHSQALHYCAPQMLQAAAVAHAHGSLPRPLPLHITLPPSSLPAHLVQRQRNQQRGERVAAGHAQRDADHQ